MKTKIRRFLLAAALASGLCSSSLIPKTNAHDFPLRSVACPYADTDLDSSSTCCPIEDFEPTQDKSDQASFRVEIPDDGIPPAPLLKTQFSADVEYGQSIATQVPYATGMCEEYAPYDLDSRDAPWLFRPKLAWNWKAGAQLRIMRALDSRVQQLADGEDDGEAELAEATPADNFDSELCVPDGHCPDRVNSTESSACPSDYINLPKAIETSLNWMDHFACLWDEELCDMHHTQAVGEGLGNWITTASQISAGAWSSVEDHFAFNRPATIIPPVLYVLYTTTDGVAVVVPAEMARAWNVDANLDDASSSSNDLAVGEIEEMDKELQESGDFAKSTHSPGADMFRGFCKRILIQASRHLNDIGIRLQQTASLMSDWAQPQIAQGTSASMR